MTLFLEDPDVQLFYGDAEAILRELPAESVHMAATSPPFFGLRDYGVEGQIGLEDTPAEWAARLVAVFEQVRRVLRADGTLWVECGDSYSASPPGNKGTPDEAYRSSGLAGARPGSRYMQTLASSVGTKRDTSRIAGYKPKDLIGAPWLLAFALRDAGWFLRSCIIWAKPNPMPESVTDRPTTAHSYVFLFSKRARYFFDAEPLREPNVIGTLSRNFGPQNKGGVRGDGNQRNGWAGDGGRNTRSVWTIATQPYPEAHFATWPEELVRRCILAGCPEDGTVLDPFVGSGTTCLVARKHGRRSIGIDLSADYLALAGKRLAQLSLLAEAT